MRREVVVTSAALAAVGLGLWSESVVYSADQVALWLPDLLTGWSLLAAGAIALHVHAGRPTGTLLMATGVTWFLGVWPATLYWHRGPLVHLLVCYVGWRGRSRLDVAAVAAGYVTAAIPGIWADDRTAGVLWAAVVVVAGCGYRTAAAHARRDRRVALQASYLLMLGFIAGVAARALFHERMGVVPGLLSYEAAIAGVAIMLLRRLPRPEAAEVADVVVQLESRDSGTLRQRLASSLGDPTIQLGYWSPGSGAYLSDEGVRLIEPAPGSNRRATLIDRKGEPFALLVHDLLTLRDPALGAVVRRATLVADSQAALRAAVEEQSQEIVASSRRMQRAGNAERQILAAELERGPIQRLAEVERILGSALPADGPEGHLARARGHVNLLALELQEVTVGLRPRDLSRKGLTGALVALGQRSPLRVEVRADLPRLPDEIEATAYFVVAEALANVGKHARASHVDVHARVTRNCLRVTVTDDGVGGASLDGGTGLAGLHDRVVALGGDLTIDSPPNGGTRIVATLPIDLG